MFNECFSLISLPNISNWNTSNITDISYMYIFNKCFSLISLPDISNWNTTNVTKMSFMFDGLNLLISLADKLNFNTSKFNLTHTFFQKSKYKFFFI